MKKPIVSDFIILILPIFLIILLVTKFILSPYCQIQGGSLNGTCTDSSFNEIYNLLNTVSTILLLTTIIWVPIYLLFYLRSTVNKIFIIRTQGYAGIISHSTGMIMWLITTVPTLLLVILLF